MSENVPSRDHRWALASCLVLVLLLIGGPASVWLVGSARQQQAVGELRGSQLAMIYYDYDLDDEIEFTHQQPPGPDWLRDRLGIDYLTTVRGVHMAHPTDSALAQLLAFPQLRLLRLDNSRELTADGFERIAKLTQLEKLDLHGIKIDNQALSALAKLPRLRIVGFVGCHELTDAGLDEISQIAGLTRLELLDCRQITNRGVARFGGLPNLQRLDIAFTRRLSDEVLKELQSAPKLRQLGLTYNSARPGKGLKYLAGFAALDELEIHGPQRPIDDNLKQLPELPNLKRFYLSDYECTRADGLVFLERMPNLEKLELWRVGLNRVALSPIARLQLLRSLALDECVGVDEAGLADLSALSRLESLSLIENRPGQKVIARAIAELRQSLPGCQIYCGKVTP